MPRLSFDEDLRPCLTRLAGWRVGEHPIALHHFHGVRISTTRRILPHAGGNEGVAGMQNRRLERRALGEPNGKVARARERDAVASMEHEAMPVAALAAIVERVLGVDIEIYMDVPFRRRHRRVHGQTPLEPDAKMAKELRIRIGEPARTVHDTSHHPSGRDSQISEDDEKYGQPCQQQHSNHQAQQYPHLPSSVPDSSDDNRIRPQYKVNRPEMQICPRVCSRGLRRSTVIRLKNPIWNIIRVERCFSGPVAPRLTSSMRVSACGDNTVPMPSTAAVPARDPANSEEVSCGTQYVISRPNASTSIGSMSNSSTTCAGVLLCKSGASESPKRAKSKIPGFWTLSKNLAMTKRPLLCSTSCPWSMWPGSMARSARPSAIEFWSWRACAE